MFKEFKSFIMQGSVVDLAIAVIIGGAFQKIVDAMVENLIMPLIGIALGGIDFSKEVIKVGDATLGWGLVFQAILNFIIDGFVLYMLLKSYNTAAKNKNASYAPEATPSEALLADIKKIMENIDAKTK